MQIFGVCISWSHLWQDLDLENILWVLFITYSIYSFISFYWIMLKCRLTAETNYLQSIQNQKFFLLWFRLRHKTFFSKQLRQLPILCLNPFQFVAHPNVQQLLASMWYEGLPGFRQMNMILQGLEICRIGLLFPIYSLCYIVCPWATFSQAMRKPFIKFICNSASYFFFLCK